MSELIPPDKSQCQALVPNGANFMTLGGKPKHIRCAKTPSVIATEKVAGEDGMIGSMSLCDDCKAVMIQQLGVDFANFEPIAKSEKWYFTFMFSDNQNRNKYICFEGSFEEARSKMVERFGLKWAFQYSEEEFAGQPEKYRLTELK